MLNDLTDLPTEDGRMEEVPGGCQEKQGSKERHSQASGSLFLSCLRILCSRM